jgi:hypothetical protein
MSNKYTGGPAYPDPGRAQSSKVRESIKDTGMTIRDKFAETALHAMLTEPAWNDNQRPVVYLVMGRHPNSNEAAGDYYAAAAFRIADAMLRAREA